jgi:acetyl esterase
MVLPASLLALGTFVPALPYAGSIGMWLFPPAAGLFLVNGLVGAMLALLATRRGPRRTGVVLTILGVLSSLAAGFVMSRHAQVAKANGVSLNLLATAVPRGAGSGAPDETTAYMQADGQDLNVDIYRVKSSSGALAPIAIHIHGGGWNAGGRRDKAANLRWFADRGYLGVSLDYELSTPEKATWQTAASQLACGLSWIATHAASYGGDADRLFVFGESAGGALALTTAYAAAAGVAASSCGGQVPRVRAVAAQVPAVDPIGFYQNADPLQGRRSRQMMEQYLGGTPMAHPDRAQAVSPAGFITAQAPPTLIVLSNDDHLVPIEGALRLIERTKQAGVATRVVRFPWADHGAGVLFYSIVNQTWLQVMQQHFCRHGGGCG